MGLVKSVILYGSLEMNYKYYFFLSQYWNLLCGVNYIYCKPRKPPTHWFTYYGVEIVNLRCVYCVFLACLYKRKSKYTRKNNNFSVENNLYSQWNTSNLECIFLENHLIFDQIWMIGNISFFRLKLCYRLSHNTAGIVILS
jgi:hypothetical protein